jgi:hypothetical protein
MSLNLGFSWSVSEFTYQYRFQLATDYNFNNLVSEQNVTANGIVVKNLSPTTTFYWRVKAINDNGESGWSDIYTFTTAAPKPDKPSLLSPPNGQQNASVIPLLSWSNIPGAEKYQVQVSYKSDFSGFSVIIDKNDVQDTLYQVEADKLNFNTTYYWRVASIAAGQKSTFSSVWTFRTKNIEPVPAQTILSQPSNNKEKVEYNPILDWEDAQSATSYRVQVATSFNFKENEFAVNKTVPNSTYQVMSGELKQLTTYFWRVQGVNESGYGEWSQIWNFKTDDFSSVSFDNLLTDKFELVPNPVKHKVIIKSINNLIEDYKFEVYDLLGNKVLDLDEKNSNSFELLFDVSNFQVGSYFLRIRKGTKFAIIKFEKI